MAFDPKHKFRRRTLAALALALSATLTMSVFAACASTESTDDEEEETTTSQTDTQKIRNGNFEFYSEMDEETEDKLDLISSPDSWSFTSGSPTSDSKSGIIDTTEWDYLTQPGRPFTSVEDAAAHWTDEGVTAYDRLKFFDEFEDEIDDLDSDSEEAELFDEYGYSIDYNDVEFLADISETPTPRTGAKEDETGILMIHNHRTSEGVVGTGQYYTSSTSVTLEAGTAAEVSLWVRTDDLTHYAAPDEDGEPVAVKGNAGAYIRVNQTVGGSGSATQAPYPAYIENINTNGEWKQYTVYLRANSYAASTFTLVLGLGQGSSDQRLEYVNGFAFFDDVTCTLMEADDFDAKTAAASCNVDTKAEDKRFEGSSVTSLKIDLDVNFTSATTLDFAADPVAITKDPDGGKSNVVFNGTYPDDYAQLTTVGELKAAAEGQTNPYLSTVYENEFKGGYLFDDTADDATNVVMLLSVSGAPYTATSDTYTLGAGLHMFVSFWVKTSEIGGTGASATLVDGENRTQIAAFDSTTVAGVDIEDLDKEDIYNGWVRCFFFISNTTKSDKTFHIEFSYGPTDVATAEATAYDDGYAAFANFEVIENVNRRYIDFAAAGTYAQKVSLTGDVDNDSAFDTVGSDFGSPVSEGPAAPANFKGMANANSLIVSGGVPNALPEGLVTGLLNARYANNYMKKASGAEAAAWAQALNTIANSNSSTLGGLSAEEEWWAKIFGDYDGDGDRLTARVANQPLVILNTKSEPVNAYGFQSGTFTVAADSYQRISLRVKLSADATATIYLLDTSDVKAGYDTPLSPTLPSVTFWYDDSGNIVKGDPSSEDFNSRTDVLFYLEENGLYTKAGADDTKFYANLMNYDKDEDGNLVAVDENGNTTIAYYAKDGKFYAYRDEDTGALSQEVLDVYGSLTDEQKKDTDYVRYNYTGIDTKQYESVITVKGTPENAGRWTEVSFYIHTGNTAKNYLLEVWAGSREYSVSDDGKVTPTGTQIPANGYVFFDDYTSTDVSENYDSVLSETEDTLRRSLSLTTEDDLPEEYALYYTFTFYDAQDYLRYDATTDEDKLGNPYGSYAQSQYSEGLAWLRYSADGEESMFLDYATTDVTVEEDDLSDDDTTTDEDDGADTGDTNVWLIVSSGLLAFALVFAIVAIIVRRIAKKAGRHVKVKPAKDKRVKPKKQDKAAEAPAEEAPADEADAEPVDENDPYNE